MTSKEAYNYLLGLLELEDDIRWPLVKESMDKFKELIDQQSNPTLSECIKEWEEEDFNVREENNYIYITPKDKVRNEKIMIRLLFKDVYPNAFLTSKQLELLTKTLKALEVK